MFMPSFWVASFKNLYEIPFQYNFLNSTFQNKIEISNFEAFVKAAFQRYSDNRPLHQILPPSRRIPFNRVMQKLEHPNVKRF